jgi:CheY-like chemotaxis protein/putative methionine-R-sulfoxide reductase with GAF domain
MVFDEIEKALLSQSTGILKLYKILKEGFHAKSVDVLFYDEKEESFFDKVNKIKLAAKFLSSSSIIGTVFHEKKRLYVDDLKEHPHYYVAIDNPFKLQLDNQLVIPILKINKVIGFIRISGMKNFTEQNFKQTYQLDEVFLKIFETALETDEVKELEDTIFLDRLKVFASIAQIQKHLNIIADNTLNQEVFKLIETGKANIHTINTYLTSATQQDTPIQEPEKRAKGVNILIADDIKINVQILKSMLSVESVVKEIKLAYDGIEALEVLERCQSCEDEGIRIIFLDHHMPGRLGTDIANDLRLNGEGNKDIIIVSISNDEKLIEQNRELYDYHLPKPFTKDNVNSVMEKIKNEKLDAKKA